MRMGGSKGKEEELAYDIRLTSKLMRRFVSAHGGLDRVLREVVSARAS